MKNNYTGSCLCGDVTFSVDGFSQQIANCHCTMCRKFHGAAYGTLVAVSGLQWNTGSNSLQKFVGENGTIRTFCQKCGSSIGFRVKDAKPEEIELAISLFDQDIPVKVDAQIFLNYKANWCYPDPGIPEFPESRNG